MKAVAGGAGPDQSDQMDQMNGRAGLGSDGLGWAGLGWTSGRCYYGSLEANLGEEHWKSNRGVAERVEHDTLHILQPLVNGQSSASQALRVDWSLSSREIPDLSAFFPVLPPSAQILPVNLGRCPCTPGCQCVSLGGLYIARQRHYCKYPSTYSARLCQST